MNNIHPKLLEIPIELWKQSLAYMKRNGYGERSGTDFILESMRLKIRLEARTVQAVISILREMPKNQFLTMAIDALEDYVESEKK